MTARQEIATVKSLLKREDYQGRFKEILGARAAQFSASVVNISRDDNIAKCDPGSVIAAAIVAATLDLPVDRNLGFAWIVPYKGSATFQVGFKGLIQLALRSGQYARMNARPVNKEAFGGYDEVGEPIILWGKIDDAKPVVGYAFAWKLVCGFSKTCYWSRERVEGHAKQYSQAYRKDYSTPWKTHFDQMALKTVIKNELADWGILSIEMQHAMKHDQGAQTDIESEVVYADNTVEIKKPDFGDDDVPMEPSKAPIAVLGVAVDGAQDSDPVQTPQNAPEANDEPPPTPEVALGAVRTLCKADGVTEEALMNYAAVQRLSRKGQTKLDQLSTAKLVQIVKAWNTIVAEIKKPIDPQPPQV